MKTKPAKRKNITFNKGSHEPYPYKLAVTPGDHKKNLELLYVLQRLAYPEMKPGIRMKKHLVRIIRPGKLPKRNK